MDLKVYALVSRPLHSNILDTIGAGLIRWRVSDSISHGAMMFDDGQTQTVWESVRPRVRQIPFADWVRQQSHYASAPFDMPDPEAALWMWQQIEGWPYGKRSILGFITNWWADTKIQALMCTEAFALAAGAGGRSVAAAGYEPRFDPGDLHQLPGLQWGRIEPRYWWPRQQ